MKLNKLTCGMVVCLSVACLMPSLSHADDVVIDDEVWIVLVDDSAGHLQKARESFLKRHVHAAAAEIEKGAAFCRLIVADCRLINRISERKATGTQRYVPD